MNEGKFIAIRNYLEELASQNKQIIGQLQRTNELLTQLTAPSIAIGEVVTADGGVDTGKRSSSSTNDAPPLGTLETEPPPAASASKPKASAKKGK